MRHDILKCRPLMRNGMLMIPSVSTRLPSMLIVLPLTGCMGLSYNLGWRRRKRSLIQVFSQPVSHRTGCSSLSILTGILALYIGLGSGVMSLAALVSVSTGLELGWVWLSPTRDGPWVTSSVTSFPNPGLSCCRREQRPLLLLAHETAAIQQWCRWQTHDLPDRP